MKNIVGGSFPLRRYKNTSTLVSDIEKWKDE